MPVPIKYTDPGQETARLQKVAEDVAGILTDSEEILYVALQGKLAGPLAKDCAVATSNRVIFYRPQLLGRANFEDYQWQDVKAAHIKQGMLATEFHVETIDGRQSTLGNLDKDQAKRLYAICQQFDQEWREKRRIREMEQDRARSGGVFLNASGGSGAAPQTADADPVAKLEQAKSMLDKGLISQAEYDTVKAKIIASM